MIDENPAADGRAGVDFDARPDSRRLRDTPGHSRHAPLPQKIGHFMRDHDVKAGIAEDYLKSTASGGVLFQDVVYVFEQFQGKISSVIENF